MIYPLHVNPIIKLTEECNYSCDFCRYANHRQKDNGIPVEIACEMIQQCASYNLKHNVSSMNVIFHGGEPLLYSLENLHKILENEVLIAEKGINISNTIQTNASLINDKWLDLFQKYSFSVGISLDGPLELNCHYSNNPQASLNNALSAYKAIKSRGLDCGLLSVITEKHLEKGPLMYFDFLLDNEISSVGLCYCFNRLDDKNVNPTRLGDYLVELFDLYFSSKTRIRIREFDMTIRRILGHPWNECTLSCRQSCGSFFTVRPDGSVEFCDDYDLQHDGTLGNINDNTLDSMIETKQYQSIANQSRQIVTEKCVNCQVFDLCRSGCSRNDINGENYFCVAFKRLYPHIKTTVQEYLSNRE